jgi:putative transposase
MPLQGHLNVERTCHLAQVSRAGFYRYLREDSQAEEEVMMRSAVQELVIAHRWRYGYRRVTAELRAKGMLANHKRVLRIMVDDNLLAVHRDCLRASDSDQSLRGARIHLNLPNRMVLSGPNQLWVADITYIRVAREFVFLAVVLDVFSRKIIGWELGRGLTAQLPLCALERAIANRNPPPGVVHHSDQGVQYTSRAYRDRLREHQIVPSMSRPGNPYDNATCESFMKTLKREEIHAVSYHDFGELHNRIEEFIEQYYNRDRLHSALSYRSPEGFEDAIAARPQSARGAILNYFAR